MPLKVTFDSLLGTRAKIVKLHYHGKVFISTGKFCKFLFDEQLVDFIFCPLKKRTKRKIRL